MSEWIWCVDKMPDGHEVVIGYDVFYGRVGLAQRVSWHDGLDFVDTDDCSIVAWMPLPSPPSEVPQDKMPQD